MARVNMDGFVWAKIEDSMWWPGVIIKPSENVNAVNINNKNIFLFGSNQYVWVKIDNIKPYLPYKTYIMKGNKTKQFQLACKEIEIYIKEIGVNDLIDNNETSETELQGLLESEPSIATIDVSQDISIINAINSQNFSIDKSQNELQHESNINEFQSTFKFGFIGLGNTGFAIVNLLLKSGHKLVIWDQTSEKRNHFMCMEGVTVVTSPFEVIKFADITLCCIDSQQSKDFVLGFNGIISKITSGKGFVEMSCINPDSSTKINVAIQNKGARYLEVMFLGENNELKEGNLICFSGGDKSLYDDCQSIFCTIAKKTIFMGEVGIASKCYLISTITLGTIMAGTEEAISLAHIGGLKLDTIIDIFKLCSWSSEFHFQKINDVINIDHSEQRYHTIKHTAKDLSVAINLVDTVNHSCLVASTAKEVLKVSKILHKKDENLVKRLGNGNSK